MCPRGPVHVTGIPVGAQALSCPAPPHPTLQGSGTEHLPLGAPQRGSDVLAPWREPRLTSCCRAKGRKDCVLCEPALFSLQSRRALWEPTWLRWGWGRVRSIQKRLEPLWSRKGFLLQPLFSAHRLYFLSFLKKFIFIYLTALGLSCSMWDLYLWHVGSSFLTRD